MLPQKRHFYNVLSLRSRRLEVVGARKKTPRVSSSRAPVLSCAHYFQAPATQAQGRYPIETLGFFTTIVSKQHVNKINWRSTFNYRAGLNWFRTITSSCSCQSHDQKTRRMLMNFLGLNLPGVKIRRQTRKLHSI